jgi:hypothetical protein
VTIFVRRDTPVAKTVVIFVSSEEQVSSCERLENLPDRGISDERSDYRPERVDRDSLRVANGLCHDGIEVLETRCYLF